MPTKVAVIQKPPVLLDRDKTIVRALASIDEAAREGATLLIFGRRRGCRSADKRDELASPHSITSSARASNLRVGIASSKMFH
jgi:predicted amidohydrolase